MKGKWEMKENNTKMIGVIAILANLSITVVELLVLIKVLPYKIIGGGQLESYGKAAMLAGFSIFVQVFLMYCIMVETNIISQKKFKKIAYVVLRVFSVYFLINIVMNLMGKTWFEKIFCSIICLVQIVCFVVICRRQREESHRRCVQ